MQGQRGNRVRHIGPPGHPWYFSSVAVRADCFCACGTCPARAPVKARSCHDLAEHHPDKLRELVSLWWTEAGKYGVLTLDARSSLRGLEPRPSPEEGRTRFVYWPGSASVPDEGAADVRNRSH